MSPRAAMVVVVGWALFVASHLAFAGSAPYFTEVPTKKLSQPKGQQGIKIPKSLMEEINKVYLPLVFEPGRAEGKTKLEIPQEFFGFKVYLVERASRVLGGQNYEITFGLGGGTLDLSEFVRSDRRGSFYLGIVPDVDLKGNDLRVFFLSNSRARTVDGVNIGNGCSEYYDLTGYFKRTMSRDGILNFTADQRYVGLLSGTYFFAVSYEGKLFLSYLNVGDSRYPLLQCHRSF